MVRTVDKDLNVVQNLVRLHLLEKSMDHKNIAVEVGDTLEKTMKLSRVCTKRVVVVPAWRFGI